MSYTIQYGDNYSKHFDKQGNTKRSLKKLLFPVLFALCIVSFLIKPVRTAVFDALFPGDSTTTFRAVEDMARNLKEGENLKSAFTDFCIEIVSNA